jgi:hypothetical protein
MAFLLGLTLFVYASQQVRRKANSTKGNTDHSFQNLAVSLVVTTCITASSLGIVVVCTWLIFEKWSSPSQDAQNLYGTPPGAVWMQATWQSIWNVLRSPHLVTVLPLNDPVPRQHPTDHESHPQRDALSAVGGDQQKQSIVTRVGYPTSLPATPIDFTCVPQLDHFLNRSEDESWPYKTTLSAPYFETEAYWVHQMAFSPNGMFLIAQCAGFHKLWKFDQVRDH